jgi:uncharacterized protein YutE (UPF0331/DUF86 family)
MTPDIDIQFLRAKLIFVIERLEYLEQYSGHTLEELARNFERLKAVEKVIQEIVDCAVDINQYLSEGFLNVEIRSNKDSFWKIQGLLKREDDSIRKLIDTVSFRNEIVHSYDAGIKIVWKKRTVSYFVELYRDYARDINGLISSVVGSE